MNASSAGLTRVLMTADTVGGVWTYAIDLARVLSSHSIQVVLATMGARMSAGQRRQARSVPGLEIWESAFKLEWMESPWADVASAGQWLRELESRVRPDVVHLNGYAHGALPWRAPCVIVAHSCVLSWWRAVHGKPAPPSWDVYRNAVRRGLSAADVVVAPSRAMLEDLRRCYGPLRATAVAPNGRDPSAYRVGRKQPFILSAGRVWDEAKNLALLAGIQPFVEWPIQVAGDDAHPNGGRRPLAHVRLLGRLSERQLAQRYANAAIYCLPARYEPFGLSVLEAALSGCALALGDIPSLRENWDGAAEFAPPGDASRFVSLLNSLIHCESRRKELAAAALARSRQFGPRQLADAYLAIYRDVLRRRMPIARAGD